MVSIGMLLQTVIQGIPLDPLGMPQQTIGEMGLRMFNDAKAAISMGKMDGLLRRVRHLELRVKYCQHFAQNSASCLSRIGRVKRIPQTA